VTYRVEILENPADDYEEQLNEWESEGWTLAHVVPGFSTALEGSVTVRWTPRFILHKPTKHGVRLHV
jgi:hypothetical protein